MGKYWIYLLNEDELQNITLSVNLILENWYKEKYQFLQKDTQFILARKNPILYVSCCKDIRLPTKNMDNSKLANVLQI